MVQTSKTRIISGIAITFMILLGVTVCIVVLKNKAESEFSLLPNGGEFNSYLAALEVENPYNDGASRLVLRSSNAGTLVIDEATNWWASDSRIYPGYLREKEWYEGDYEKVSADPERYPNSWLYGPTPDTSKWADNTWDFSHCDIDLDCDFTGVPNIVAQFERFYPSDSNGNPDDTYGHKVVDVPFIDDEGNSRTHEVHIGFVVAEYNFIIQPDYDVEPIPYAEVFGWYKTGYESFREFYGSPGVDFSITFRVDIVGLEIDGWYLNPDWLNLGNGIMEVNSIGFFGDITNTAASGWMVSGQNNIEAQAYRQLMRYDTLDAAIYKSMPISDLSETMIDFDHQTPDKVYFNLEYSVNQFGYHWDYENFLHLETDYSSMKFQELEFTQKVLIKFYTSQCAPLGPDANDPLTITRITSTYNDDLDPDQSGWIRKAWDWLVANVFGGKEWLAILSFVLGIPLFLLIVGAIIVAVMFGPGALLIPFRALGKSLGR